jgi:hypothetical protein
MVHIPVSIISPTWLGEKFDPAATDFYVEICCDSHNLRWKHNGRKGVNLGMRGFTERVFEAELFNEPGEVFSCPDCGRKLRHIRR